VSGHYVVTASRDFLDQNDVIQCFDTESGELLWQHLYPAAGRLDYGNSPRATPLIHDGSVYSLGAFGDLCCLELETGLILWQVNIAKEFHARPLTWGHSGSPILSGNRLIVQPGGSEGSLVALDSETGDVIWKTPGTAAGYSSLLLKAVKQTEQVIGYDADSLGGWDAKTGKRLWRLSPAVKGDFNVPTVVSLDDRIVVASENNGTRIYHFADDGTLHPEPDAVNEDLKPDSHTPAVSGGRIFGIWNEFYCLDPDQQLKTAAMITDDAFGQYGSLIVSDRRALVLSGEGELILIATDQDKPGIISRLKLTKTPVRVLAHPAVAGNAMYVRLGKTLGRLNLK
jgi:outer membrane protein assembly factor BamB